MGAYLRIAALAGAYLAALPTTATATPIATALQNPNAKNKGIIVEGRVGDLADGAFILNFGRGRVLVRVGRDAYFAGEDSVRSGDWVQVWGRSTDGAPGTHIVALRVETTS